MTPRALSLVGCGVFVVIIAALHVLRPDLPPLQRGMSRYAGGDTLLLATIAFLAFVVGWLAAAAHLRASYPRATPPLVVAAAGMLVVTLTPIGGPSPGLAVLAVHTLGGIMFYLGTLRAMFATAITTRGRRLAWTMVVVLVLFALGAFDTPGLEPVTGALQRAIFVLAFAWLARAGA